MADNATMQEIHDYLEECAKKTGTFYLMTVDGDKPACRPVSFHMLVDGKEYFGVGTFKDAYKQMVANPNVQIVGCKGANWIRVSGTAVFDDDPYNEENGRKMGIFRLENGNAQFIEKMMEVVKTVEF